MAARASRPLLILAVEGSRDGTDDDAEEHSVGLTDILD